MILNAKKSFFIIEKFQKYQRCPALSTRHAAKSMHDVSGKKTCSKFSDESTGGPEAYQTGKATFLLII